MKRLVSIIAPVYNEEAVIEEFVRRICETADGVADQYDVEVVLVDDGSKDRTLGLMKAMAAKEPRLRVVELSRNYGQTPALQAGLDAARGEIFVTLDADLQHFPEEIPLFLERLDEGYDMVCGWRRNRREGWLRRWPSRAANALIRKISGLNIHDFGTTFRVYRRELACDLRLFGDFHRYIPVLGHQLGGRITEIPIENVRRPKGKSNYGITRTFGVALDLFFLYFFVNYYDRPLRVFGKLAMAMFGVGFAILAGLLVYGYMTGIPTVRERSGWFLLSAMLQLAALQIMLAGTLGEIQIRTHFAVGNRRVYRVRNVWGADRPRVAEPLSAEEFETDRPPLRLVDRDDAA